LCEDGKAIVVAADKMVTFGAPMSLQMEPAVLRKITTITDDSVVLFSGSVPDAEEIVAATKLQIKGLGKLPTLNVAEAVKTAYSGLSQTCSGNDSRPFYRSRFRKVSKPSCAIALLSNVAAGSCDGNTAQLAD
jgi:20S proteasome alpha/beta subunit